MSDQSSALREAFDALVDRSGGPDACWPWMGGKHKKGYGRLSHGGKAHHATHLALEFDGRPVPKGMFGLHECDNPPCCNPAHLYPGTKQTNADDMVRRGRTRWGPGARARVQGRSASTKIIYVRLPPALKAAIEACAREAGVSTNVLVLRALEEAVAAFQRQRGRLGS